MKRILPLLLIISLLLCSCQLSSGKIIATPSDSSLSYSETETFTYKYESTSLYDVQINESEANITSENTYQISGTTLHVFKPVTTTFKHTQIQNTTSIATSKTTQPSTAKQTVRATLPATTKKTTKPNPTSAPVTQSELRGIWISCYDHIPASGKTREQYKSAVDTMFKNIKSCGLNTAFVHLRAFSDAFYKSEIYPYSSYIAGKEGASLPFDPFEVILECANKYSISVHGWINPFRVSTKNDVSLLSSTNPAKKIIDSGNSNGEIDVLSNGIYYNPSCTSNHQLIYEGVREILTKYDIDGIHIDDYFYPSTDKSIDKKQYSQYTANGGTLSLSEWRKACVNAFVSGLYSTVKAADQSVTVSISPAAQLDKNLNEYYADCELWLSRTGYADLIIPQIYFGFKHETLPFNALLKKWSSLPRASGVKLACGIGAYKCSETDKYAGTGSDEWKTNTDILARQVRAIRNNKSYGGFAVFSYKDLIRGGCKAEIQNLRTAVSETATEN